MAVRSEAWNGSRSQVGVIAQPAEQSRILSLEQRKARLQRRRRRSRAQAALTAVVWLAGSGAVGIVALAGMFGLLR
jgi:hypothetical protein